MFDPEIEIPVEIVRVGDLKMDIFFMEISRVGNDSS
jgi:hypothetical protein